MSKSAPITVQVIPVDGPVTTVPYPESLEDIQALVGGGLFEQVLYADDAVMLANEEGLFKEMEYNSRASLRAGRYLVGPCVLLEGAALKRWLEDV